MNSNLMGTRQFPEISVLQNQSDISLITQNTNQNYVAHHVIIPLTIIPFSKKDTKNNAIMYVDTVFGNIIAPNLSSITPLLRIEHLSNKMIEIRDDIIQTGKKVFSQDVQHQLLHSPLIQQRYSAELDSISSQGNTHSIFQYLSEKYEILDFVQITSPIFLSPVILHKGWVITLKETIEAKYRFTISRIEGYDTSRCENFVRMIAHKNIKDTVEKWYNNILIRYGYKLLTKKPKGDKCIVSQIVINHPAIDNRFQSSHIYIVKTKATFGESINTSFRSGTITSNETDEDDRVREEQRILTDAIVYEFETSMCASGTINTSNETIGVDMERTDGGIYDVPEGDNDEDEGKRFLHSCYDHFDDIDFFLIIVFDFVQIMMKFVSLMVSQFLLLT